MKQIALALNLSVKKTRKRELLEQMEKVVLWAALVKCIAPFNRKAKPGGHRFPCKPCSASISCSYGSHHLTPPWRRTALTRWCTASSPGSMSFRVCQMSQLDFTRFRIHISASSAFQSATSNVGFRAANSDSWNSALSSKAVRDRFHVNVGSQSEVGIWLAAFKDRSLP